MEARTPGITAEDIRKGKVIVNKPVTETAMIVNPTTGQPESRIVTKTVAVEEQVMPGLTPAERETLANLIQNAGGPAQRTPDRQSFFNPFQPNLVPTVVP
jgi:hypothetical protein